MASSFYTNAILGRGFLDTLERRIVLPRLMWRDAEAEFAGSVGRSVEIRRPQVRTASKRTAGAVTALTAVDGSDEFITITLDQHIYDLQNVTDFSETVDISDRVIQVTGPMIRAVSRGLEDEAALVMTGATYPGAGQFTHSTASETPDDLTDQFSDISVYLDSNDVDVDGRYAVAGTDATRVLQKSDLLRNQDTRGSAGPSMLRDRTIGNVYGFDVVKSNAIPSDKVYLFHDSAYLMAIRSPIRPHGAASARSMRSENGQLAITMVEDYDPNTAQDRVLVHSFCGTTVNTDGGTLLRAAEMTITAV